MNQHDAEIWNAAIRECVRRYRYGVDEIKAMHLQPTVTVEHVGTTTKQDVRYDDD